MKLIKLTHNLTTETEVQCIMRPTDVSLRVIIIIPTNPSLQPYLYSLTYFNMYDLINHSHLLSTLHYELKRQLRIFFPVIHTHFSVKNLSKHGRVKSWKKKFIRERICRIVQFSTNGVVSRSPSCQLTVNCMKFECYFFSRGRALTRRYTASRVVQLNWLNNG